eukprot:SAG31_NODE_912_length_11066_cov_4.092186_7_plen_65_part_00
MTYHERTHHLAQGLHNGHAHDLAGLCVAAHALNLDIFNKMKFSKCASSLNLDNVRKNCRISDNS